MIQVLSFMVARTSFIVALLLGLPAHAEISASTQQVLDAAMERTRANVIYDGAYRSIPYPMGDVPNDIGVCTDLVIRALRAVEVDLQQRVHEDMSLAFDEYPGVWGLSRPDPNIDHRRVPNLERFFERQGAVLGADELSPGDFVTWRLPGNLPHIGIVASERSSDGERPLIIHNIGRGPVVEDMIDRHPITGRYRFPLPL